MAAHFAKVLMASRALGEMKAEKKRNEHSVAICASSKVHIRAALGRHEVIAVSKLFPGSVTMASANIKVHLYPQGAWMNCGACLPATSFNSPAKICKA